MKKLLLFIFSFLLFFITTSAFALPLSYEPGSGGEMLLKPIQQGDRPWDVGSYNDIDDWFRDDTDFIQSRPLGKSAQDLVDFKFSTGLDAHQPYDHVLRVVYKEGGLGINNPNLTFILKEGDVEIEEWTDYGLPSVFTLEEHTISPINMAKVSDYGNLYITIRAWCDNTCLSTPGYKEVVQISWLDFSYHKTRSDDTDLHPSLIGVGVYQIEQNTVRNPYSEDDSFSSFYPYSVLTDETDILRYGQIDDYEKFGTFFFTIDENTFVPLTTGVLERPVQLQLLFHDDFQSDLIQHVDVTSVVSGQHSKLQAPLFEIELEKGKNPIVTDKHEILKDVFTSWSLEEGYLWTNIDLTFKQILPKSDFIIRVWDQQRISQEFKFLEILEVSKTNESKLEENIDLTADVIISHDSSSPVCQLTLQCFTPYNAKILQTGIVTWINHDEVVHSIVSGNDSPNNRFAYYVFPGKSVQHRFDVLGEYNYFCDLHPWARGKITVVDKNYQFDTTDEKTDIAPILVYSVTSSGSLLVENNDSVIKENRGLWFEITGNISEDIGRKRITLKILSPNGDEKVLRAITNEKGYYSIPVVLHKKWLPGEYTITSQAGDITIGKVSFIVKDNKK